MKSPPFGVIYTKGEIRALTEKLAIALLEKALASGHTIEARIVKVRDSGLLRPVVHRGLA